MLRLTNRWSRELVTLLSFTLLSSSSLLAQEPERQEAPRREADQRERPPRERERGEPSAERAVLQQQIEVLKRALPALRETDKKEAVELLERAIRAREVALEGRRDDEARAVRERAPDQRQLVEILEMAAGVWQEFGKEENAVVVRGLAKALSAPRDRERAEAGRRGEREGDEERPAPERDAARKQLDIMRSALPALREAERRDALELLERAIRAREVMLEGRRDDEAQTIRERAPSQEQLGEILDLAAGAWREFGREENAAALRELADVLRRPRDRDREGEPERRRLFGPREQRRGPQEAGGGSLYRDVAELRAEVREMHQQMEEMQKLLRRLVERLEEEE